MRWPAQMTHSVSFLMRVRALLAGVARFLFRVLHWHARAAARLSAGLLCVAGVLWAALTFWLFPSVDQYRDDIARFAGSRLGIPLEVGHIEAGWDDFQPAVLLTGVTLHDRHHRPALVLDQIRMSLSWLSLLVFDARFAKIALDRPSLVLRRDRQGTLFLADLPLTQGGDGRFGNWLLRQHRIQITEGRLGWIDEQQQLPLLQIEQVNLRIHNVFRNHRFELTGVPPEKMASAFRLSGTLRGDDVNQPADWGGDIKVDLQYADLTAWSPWLHLPAQIKRGHGGVSTWFAFDQARLRQGVLTLDVADAAVQFATDLPVLSLQRLKGEVDLRSITGGHAISLRQMFLEPAHGPVLRQKLLTLERTRDSRLPGTRLALTADSVQLADWLAYSEYLPLGDEARIYLNGLKPSGQLSQIRAALSMPADPGAAPRLELNAAFDGLTVTAFRDIPGLDKQRGYLAAGPDGGSLTLGCQQCTLVMPQQFVEPVPFRMLDSKVNWIRQGPDWLIEIATMRFANADVHGSVSGRYWLKPESAGQADLQAELLQGRADAVWRYIPLAVGGGTRDWLRTSLKRGMADRATMQLRGKLDDFPWDKHKSGVFRVQVDARDVDLEYADNWPMIHGIHASLLFEADSLTVLARSGMISGNRLQSTRAVIPALSVGDRLLIDGEVRGPMSNFLQFVAASPVNATLDGLTEGATSTGDAALRLKLMIPLDNTDGSKVSGQFALAGNRLQLGYGIPLLDQLRGTLSFTERGIRANALSANALGGRVQIGADTARDGAIRIRATGTASGAGLARAYPDPLWQQVQGETRYQLGIDVRRGSVEWLLDTNMQGVQVDLPLPLRKTAADSRPLRLQVKRLAGQQQRIQLTYGAAMYADCLLQQQRLTQGLLYFGTLAEPAYRAAGQVSSLTGVRKGLLIGGTLDQLALDPWLTLAKRSPGKGEALPKVISELRIGQLDIFGKQLHEMRINANSDGSNWTGQIQSRQGIGSFTYQTADRGRLQARLKRLSLPVADAPAYLPDAEQAISSYPALDVEIDTLQYKERNVGRLELRATHRGDTWQIDRLATVASDGRLEMEGSWSYRARKPVSRMSVRLTSDNFGKFLARFGMADTMRRGGGKLTGQLSWAGAPHQLDVPTMTGALDLEAQSGQFAKVEPGMGRLLAIVSLQALPKRITLDFRDVFSEGLAFDSLGGHFEMNRGILRTENFSIVGSSALISMKGEIDLASQTQSLNVKVVPVLGDSVSLAAGFVINPVVGLTALVVQKLLKDPLGQLMAYEYHISGKWSDPKVERLGSWLLNTANRAQPPADAGASSPYSN